MNALNSDKAPEPVGPYPHARKVGNLLFLSGVGPRKRGSKDIPGVTLDVNKNIVSYNIEEQCHSVFQNVKYILEASGSSWENLVDVTVFLTNMKDDFPIFNKIYAEYFKENQPCRTTVEVNAWWNSETVEIVISDDGPGIAPDVLKRIGEPYLSRRRGADDTQGERSGLGLGVFIARTLLERTGAKVSFTNRTFPDHGAVVQIVWPRNRFESDEIVGESSS